MTSEGPSLEQSGFRIPESDLSMPAKGARSRLRSKSKKMPTPSSYTPTSQLDVSERKRSIGKQGGPEEPIEEEKIEEIAQQCFGLPKKGQKTMERWEEELLSEHLAQLSLGETASAMAVSEEQMAGPMEIDFVAAIPLDVVMEIVDPIDIVESTMMDAGTPYQEFSLGPSIFDAEIVGEGAGMESLPTVSEPAGAGDVGAAVEAPKEKPVLPPASQEVSAPPPVTTETDVGAEPLSQKVAEEQAPRMPVVPLAPKRQLGAAERAQKHFNKGKFRAAYQLLLPLARQKPHDQKVLALTALCLEKMHRYKESLIIYRELGKRNPNDLTFKEKIADILFALGDFVRAQILYKKLQTMIVGRREDFERKIQQCKDRLRSSSEWDSFQAIFDSIGASGGPLTPHQIHEIDRINKQLVQTSKLMWDLLFLQTRKISPRYLKKHFSPVLLRSRDGRTYTAYKSPNFRFLAHFSTLENGAKILEKEIAAQQDPTIRESDDYFWNSQYKVCTSLLRLGLPAFHGGTGIGFVIDVPDPDKNILHAFVRDAWTPSYVKAGTAAFVTGQVSETMAKEYNEFMLRYQVLSEYVYSLWQHATQQSLYFHVLERIEKLDLQASTNPIYRLISAGLDYLRTWLSHPDVNKTAVKSLLAQLTALCHSPEMDSKVEQNIMAVMKQIEYYLEKGDKKSAQAKVHEERLAAKIGFETRARAPEMITSPTPFETDRPLILDYLDRTIDIAQSLLATNPQREKDLFERIFCRTMRPGEHLISQLLEMRQTMEQHLEQALPHVYKKQGGQQDRAIFCRQLSPNELLAGTKAQGYSEVGVRSHFSSHEVGAHGASFKAVVVTRASVTDGYISEKLAPLLEMAQKASLPVIYI